MKNNGMIPSFHTASQECCSRFKPERQGLRLAACALESATECGYEFALTFEGFGLPSTPLEMQVLGQEKKLTSN
jgi:hypothetical protein